MKAYIAGSMKPGWLHDEVIRILLDRGWTVLDPALSGLTDEKDYTEWDLKLIRECDLLVAFMDSTNPSGLGLNLEVGYAKGICKPIVFVDMTKYDHRHRYFGMARQCADKVVDHPFALAVYLDKY